VNDCAYPRGIFEGNPVVSRQKTSETKKKFPAFMQEWHIIERVHMLENLSKVKGASQ
jgi:hypothetical protein